MTTHTEMAQSLDKLPDDFDFNDPNALATAMGYDQADAGTEEEGNDVQQGDSATTTQAPAADSTAAAPTAAPAAAPAAPAAASPSPAKVVEQGSAPPAAAAKEEPGEVVGVLTKDGKHTLPYPVLQEARRSAAMNKARADELEAENSKLQEQIEALKSGKAQAGDGPSEEELAKLAEDFPQLAPVLQTVKALQAKVAAADQAAPKVDPRSQIDQELDAQANLDAAIAARPLLSRYQAAGGVVWGRAVEIDSALMNDPAFAGKSLSERFVEVEKRLAGELGIQLQAPTPTPDPSTPQAKATTPPVSQAALAAAPAVGPSTLSDIAGAAPVVEKDPWDDRSALEGLAAADKLSDEALMRLAGISY